MQSQRKPIPSLISETWACWAAAKDLGDVSVQLTCKRIIEAHLAGKEPRLADAHVVRSYFGSDL